LELLVEGGSARFKQPFKISEPIFLSAMNALYLPMAETVMTFNHSRRKVPVMFHFDKLAS